jgi:signal transduction histidine kinase
MPRRFRPPMFAIAAALLGLIAVLATLQYRWLGRISDAERERLRSTLAVRASAFADDVDRELTLAFRLFQSEPIDVDPDESLSVRLMNRYERWQALSRHPRIIKEYFAASAADGGAPRLQRFDPSTGFVEPVEWPERFAGIRDRLASMAQQAAPPGSYVIQTLPVAVWDDVPALLVPAPMPLLFMRAAQDAAARPLHALAAFVVLVLDRDYIVNEMLPALAQQHFRSGADGIDYQLAVVSTSGKGTVYRSTPSFDPKPDATADASADLLQVRPQEFAQLVADVRRFATRLPRATDAGRRGRAGAMATFTMPVDDGRGAPGGSLVLGEASVLRDRAVIKTLSDSGARGSARWRLFVTHPSGSLEAAVNTARRRNLLVSSSILGVLAASLVLIVVSTRRSQDLARQQMEFVAAVSHELRTPLAVIRSAGDNLADGVVRDDEQIRKYGALVRSEGRRLSEMVEQILELSGIHSGQRTFSAAPVDVDRVIASVLGASATLIEAAHVRVETDIPPDLPPISGDEGALRRVFQNLIVNAIKYGAEGGWIGITARRDGSTVRIDVRDRGMGIAPSDQARIFEPFYRAADVVAAQIQGAGLGLSLVQRIVQLHGGRIAVKSAKGAGSEFIVHLPVAAPGAGRTIEQDRARATAVDESGGPRVLSPRSADAHDAS